MAGELAYISPKGERTALAPDQVATFEALGYRPETADETLAATVAQETEKKYTGSGEGLQAFGERALSAATLGLSDLGFRALGVDAADLAGRTRYNEDAALAGTVTGLVGSALIPGAGAGAIGKAAAMTPAAKVAALTERIVGSAAGKSAAAKVGTHAAGYGLEGALFSSGQYLSDVVLGNKELSGEAFVAGMEGALFGAGLGGGLSLLGQASRAGSDAIAGLLGRKAETLLKKADAAVPDTTLAKLTPKAERTPAAVARAESKAETAIQTQHTKVDGLLADADLLLAKATEARARTSQGALDSYVDDQVGDLFARTDREIATKGNAQYAELERRAEALRKSRERVQAWQSSLKTFDPVTGEVPMLTSFNKRGQAFSTADEVRAMSKNRGTSSMVDEIAKERSRVNSGRIAKEGQDLKQFREGVEALADYERTSFRTAEAFLDLLDNVPELAASLPNAGRVAEDFAPYLDAVARDVGETVQGPGAAALFNGIKPTAKQAERIAKDQARTEAKAAKEADRAAKAELRQNIKVEKEAARAEARAAKAKAAEQPEGFSIGGLDAGDFMAANEVVGFMGADLRDVPVIGPALSAWLVASRLKGRLGNVGKVVSKATGGPLVGVAEKATELRNRLADVAQAGIKASAGARRAAIPTAVALRAPMFESAEKPLRALPRLAESKGNELLSVYSERAKELSQAVANPDAVRERLQYQYPISDPALFESIYDAAMRKINYAYEEMPIGGGEPDIYGETVDPSPVELEQWGQVYDALQKPADAMEDLLSGEPLPHVAKALKNVYPSLYQEAQEMALDEIAKDPAAVPYEKRVTLSLIFDITTDRTMRPDYLARIQVAGGEAAQADAAQPVPGIAAPTNMGLAEQTTAQRVAGGVA